MMDPGPIRDYCLRRIELGESWSDLAMRCGATKRDRYGNLSGDTSWLKRRLGLMEEDGRVKTLVSYNCAVRIVRGLGLDPVDMGV